MRKRSEDTRILIVTSARELFVSKGYTAATMSDISDRADITKKTLYGYFPDKKTLFINVIEQAVGTSWYLKEEFDCVSSVEDLYDELYSIAINLNDVFSNSNYIELLRIVIAETNFQPELKSLLSNGITRRSIKSLVQIFKSANENTIISLADPAGTARMFVGNFVMNAYLDGLLEPAPGRLQRLEDDELSQFVHGFVAMILTTKVHSEYSHAI